MTEYNRISFKIQFEPNGGDLGRAAISHVSPLELQLVLPHVSAILEELWKLNNSRLRYVYAFEFAANCLHGIKLLMSTTRLPDHVEWYSVDGHNTFEMRGASGGIVSNHIIYLVTKS